MSKPRVLVSCDHYLPGVHAGGPIRSISALAGRLGDEVDFRIVTRDRDLGATTTYPGVTPGAWTDCAGTPVLYCAAGEPTRRSLAAVLHALRPDAVYLNSLFSARFSLLPLRLRRSGGAAGTRFVIAPRGELHPGALAIRPWKKVPFLKLARATGLLDGVTWHATAAEEEDHIRRWFGADATVVMAPILAHAVLPHDEQQRPHKHPGHLEIAFLSRISPKKNLLGAIELLRDVPGEVRFNIHGPKEDVAYWERCRSAIATLPGNVTVVVHGALDAATVPAALARNHVLLFPTHGENFGHVILEALLAGVPVLLSDQTPWRDLERHQAGWDLPLARPERFRERLAALVAMDDVGLERWSRGARRHGLAYTDDASGVVRNRELFAVRMAS